MLTRSRYRRKDSRTLGLAPVSRLLLTPAAGRSWQTRGVPPFAASPGTHGPDEPCVLLKLGEIVLKGKNRQQFERILQANIRAAVRDLDVPADIRLREGVILLRVADGP